MKQTHMTSPSCTFCIQFAKNPQKDLIIRRKKSKVRVNTEAPIYKDGKRVESTFKFFISACTTVLPTPTSSPGFRVPLNFR